LRGGEGIVVGWFYHGILMDSVTFSNQSRLGLDNICRILNLGKFPNSQ
jgi:hypothetical protein